MNTNSLQVLFSSLPGRYARALFNVGEREKCLDKISKNFEEIKDLFEADPFAKKSLTNCHSDAVDEAWKITSALLSLHPVFSSFMKLIVHSGRTGIIWRIMHIFRLALDNQRREQKVSVITCVEPSTTQNRNISSLVAKFVGVKAIISFEIDRKILGGLKIVTNGMVVDASLLAQIKQMARYLTDSELTVEAGE